MSTEKYIGSIFLFENLMVAVCDNNGQQMPEFQGPYEDVIWKLRKADTSKASLHGIERYHLERKEPQP